MNKKVLKHIGAALVLITLFSILFVSLPTQKAFAVTEIVSLSPSSGNVGTMVRLNGTINTTDGFFVVRWNGSSNVTSGSATGFDVRANFTVPPTVGAPAPAGRLITVELIDKAVGSVGTANFTLFTEFDLQVPTPTPPQQLQEGSTNSIRINVTGGESNRVYSVTLAVRDPTNQTKSVVARLTNTTTIGSGSNVTIYPTNFPAAGMNYTGTYFVLSNVTAREKPFFVGLTDKSVYRRNETVNIKATGYRSLETVKLDIKLGASSVSGFPVNLTASSGGVFSYPWKVPLSAKPGNYTLSITNSTNSGTVKAPRDTQDFEILGIICQILTKNLADVPVQGATVEAHNFTRPTSLLQSASSNATGWSLFNLDRGNYTFKAFWKSVQVGSLVNQSISVDTALNSTLELTNVQVFLRDVNDHAIPFVDVQFSYNFTTRANQTRSESLSLETDLTGRSQTQNVFVNLNYSLQASRYGFELPGTPLKNRTLALPWNFIILSVPQYTASVTVIDSKGSLASGISIVAYEWSSGTTNPALNLSSDSGGGVSLTLTFGKYRLIALDDSIELNETSLNLTQNNMNFTFYLSTLNIDVTVQVRDYFGQPIANAKISVERKTDDGFVLIDSRTTDSGGSAKFTSIVGGDCRILAYVGDSLVAAQTQFLSGSQTSVMFQASGFVSILGSTIAVGVFAFLVFLITIVIICISVALITQRNRIFSRRKKS